MPLYNNATTVSRAIESLLGQSFGDFVLLTSDDGSADATVDVVSRYARMDGRIRIVQQERNLNYGNFRFLVESAATEFFMFAAGDDWWEPTFVASCTELLDERPDACCVVPRVEFLGGPTALQPGSGTYPLTGSANENIVRFLRGALDNSRMYGVFRTDAAQFAFPKRDHFAYDWTFSAASLLRGKHLEIPAVLLHREVTQSDRYLDYVYRDNHRAIDRLFPLLPLTRSLLFEKRVPLTLSIVRALVFANLAYHEAIARRKHVRYARLARPLISRLLSVA